MYVCMYKLTWWSIWCFYDGFIHIYLVVGKTFHDQLINMVNVTNISFHGWIIKRSLAFLESWCGIVLSKLGLENHDIASLRQCLIEKAVWSWKKDQCNRTIHYSSSHREKQFGLGSPSDDGYISLTCTTSSLTIIEIKWRWRWS